MKKLSYLTILWLFALMACAPDKNTKNTQQQTEYIINPPDFEELERKKTERAQGISPNKANSKPTLSKEDSIKAYIKELTHHFHLQEKQMKALEYIYAKYDKKEAQTIQLGDTARLAKLNAEKEQSIAVVLGEHYYAKKGAFDEKYINEKQNAINKTNKVKYSFYEIPPKGTKPLARSSNRYVEALRKELNLNQKQITKLKSMLRQYDHKKDRLDSIQINELNENKIQMEKEILGLNLYKSKLEFDQNYK